MLVINSCQLAATSEIVKHRPHWRL